jgi:hypothetical protein
MRIDVRRAVIALLPLAAVTSEDGASRRRRGQRP